MKGIGPRGRGSGFIACVLAVALSVAFVSGMFFLRASASATLQSVISGMVNADVYIQSKGGSVADLLLKSSAQQTYLASSVTGTVKALPEVASVMPVYVGPTVLIGHDGEPVSTGLAPSVALGADVDQTGAGTVIDGALPTENISDVALEESTAKAAGLSVGDSTKVIFNGTTLDDAKVVGIVSYGSSMGGAVVVILNPTAARALFVPPNTVSFLAVKAQAGTSPTQLRDVIAPELEVAANQGSDPNAEAVLGSVVGSQAEERVEQSLSPVNLVLAVLALASVVVAGFALINMVSTTLRGQSRQLGMVKALGASNGQMLSSMVKNSVVVGLIGSVIGLIVGFGLATGVRAILARSGLSLGWGLPWIGIVVSLVVGVCLAVVATWLAGWRVIAKTAPTDVRPQERSTGFGAARLVCGVVFLVVGVAGVIWGLKAFVGWYVGAGVILILAGIVGLAPVLVAPLASAVAAGLRPFSPVAPRLAKAEIVTHRRKTANLAGVFLVCAAVTSACLVFASSAGAGGANTVEKGMVADYVLRPTTSSGVISDSVVGVVNSRVTDITYSTYGQAPAQVLLDGADASHPTPATVMFGPAETFVSLTDSAITEGTPEAFATGAAVSESFAKAHGLKIGDQLGFVVAPGTPFSMTTNLPVGLIVRTAIFRDVMVPATWLTDQVPNSARSQMMPATMVFVTAATGVDKQVVHDALVDTVAPYGSIEVLTRDQLISSTTSQASAGWMAAYLMIVLTALLTALATAHAVSASTPSRRRLLGLVSVMGVTPSQTRRVLVLEAAITAAVGSVLGIAIGVGVVVWVQASLVQWGMGPIMIPWLWLVGVFVVALVVAIVASAVFSRRALARSTDTVLAA
ncbi:MAG: ABC transporter permease [Propionibacteriaceae bacterium]|jgi:putative ABC transport system permease protein|nr:ABC transporter permease [Propionibacteriaceae bacterium]